MGDTTTVILAGNIHEVTVSGVVTFDASLAGASLVLLDLDTAKQAFAPDGLVSSIAVYAEGAGGAPATYPDVTADAEEDLVAAIKSALPDSAEWDVVTGTQMRDDSQAQIDSMLGFLSTFLLIFALIALFVGGFVIANTFTMTVRQKQREFAMLRAVGASPGQVFMSVTIQAILVGLIGGVLGVFGGWGLVAALQVVFEAMGMDFASTIPLTPFIITLGIATGVLVSAVSAALPARKAALTAPVEAMRDDAAPVIRPSWWRIAIGALLTLGVPRWSPQRCLLHAQTKTLPWERSSAMVPPSLSLGCSSFPQSLPNPSCTWQGHLSPRSSNHWVVWPGATSSETRAEPRTQPVLS